MTLKELKIASYLMSIFSAEDKSYKKIVAKNFNLNSPDDCKLLLKFLNEWGCRQFKIEDHLSASIGLKKWFNDSYHLLPKSSVCLIDQSDKKIKQYGKVFDAIKGSYASTDKRGVIKTVGAVGAAKTLFAIRKNMFPPWDNPIIKKLELPANGKGYTTYLLYVKEKLQKLKEECNKQNIDIKELPTILNRPHASLVKFIDEYFWLTMTKKCNPEVIIKLAKKKD